VAGESESGPLRRLSTADVAQLLSLVVGEPAPASVVAGLHRRTDGDPRKVLVHLVAALGEDGPPYETLGRVADEAASPTVRQGTFRREGDYWTLVYEGRTVRLRDARGLHYLAPLLRTPGCQIPVQDLVRTTQSGLRRADPERARQAVTKGIQLVLDRLRHVHPTLAAHLGASVRRGYACCYVPDPAERVEWEL
jgi:hypothetical protein